MSDSGESIKAQIELWKQATDAVHVDDPAAYTAFSDGRVVFGHHTEAEKVTAFKRKITSEFGSQIVEKHPTFNPGALSLIVLYHKHAYQERVFKSDAMKEVLEEYPELA
jgi:hypothetical protein